MKKIIAFIAFSVSYNLCAAQEAPEIMQITKQTEIAQTKTDKQTPSFWVRHADKLKKFSYATDIALAIETMIIIATITTGSIIRTRSQFSNGKFKNQNAQKAFSIVEKILNSVGKPWFLTIMIKIIPDFLTRYAMNKKHTFELEALQAKLDAAQQETKTETPA